MSKDLTQGRPFRVLLQFSLPVIAGNLFQLFYTLADTVIVGRTLGAQALAAVGSTTIVIYFVLCFVQGFTGGFGICLAQRFGARDIPGQRSSAAVSWLLSAGFAVIITVLFCALAHPILQWMRTPEDIYAEAYSYMFIVLLGTGATVFYNMISNMLRSLGDSRTPLFFLIFSALLNVVLDLVFILPLGMGVAGAAWATVLSQLLSAVLCTIVGMQDFDVLRTRRADFADWRRAAAKHLAVGFPMGFQMSVMCIGQLAMQTGVNALGSVMCIGQLTMQTGVNSLGSVAVAGYTAATKVDQLPVLMNNAFGIALSSFVAQNYGAGQYRRISEGVRACLVQIELCNVLMCALLLGCRHLVVPLFLDSPTAEVIRYSDGYLFAVCPFYVVLGLLMVFRTAIQSMGNSRTPFEACVIELVMRILGSVGLAALLAPYGLSYTGICLSHTLAWLGATALLMPVYFRQMKALPLSQ